MWAGYTALINQNRLLGGLSTLGLANSSLYPLAYNSTGLTSAYATDFHDINDGSSNLTVTGGTNYAAVTGFDDSTGLGTMQGTALITALSGGVLYADLPKSGSAPRNCASEARVGPPGVVSAASGRRRQTGSPVNAAPPKPRGPISRWGRVICMHDLTEEDTPPCTQNGTHSFGLY